MLGDILHIDMDAFYAAIEQRDNPEWRGKPLVVGAQPGQRGVVSTCSYEARRFGIHSAMSSLEAGRRCPHAIFVPTDMPRYVAVSRQIFAIFRTFTPLVEPLSIDEAFLDVSGAHKLFGCSRTIATKIKNTIREETGGLTASIGIAGNKFLAKLASDMKKPDGITIMPTARQEIIALLAPLPVGRLWGVGRVTRNTLQQAGYRTVGDLQKASVSTLMPLVGEANAQKMYALAHGEDHREVETATEDKSISREHTFGVDCREVPQLRAMLCELAEDVGRRLRNSGQFAATVRIKLRWSNFKTITRQKTFANPVNDDFSLREAAAQLFEAETISRPVRLIGFGVSGLSKERLVQPQLFNDDKNLHKREMLSQTIDSLRQRFGNASIQKPSG